MGRSLTVHWIPPEKSLMGMEQFAYENLDIQDALMIILEFMGRGGNCQFTWEGYPYEQRDKFMLDIQGELLLRIGNIQHKEGSNETTAGAPEDQLHSGGDHSVTD